MSLDSLVRSAVATANRVTASVQADITHEAWISQDGQAKPTYDTAVTLPAVIAEGPVPFRTALGETIVVKAIIHILQPVTANGAANRIEPIDPRDQITLPSGVVGPPIAPAPELNLVDPSTGRPYMHTIGIG